MAAPVLSGVVAPADQVAVQALGRRLTTDEFRTLLAETSTVTYDTPGAGNVANSGLPYLRVNVDALAAAILGLTDHPITPANPGSSGGTASTASVPSGERSVTVRSGDVITGVDFGNFLPGTVAGTVYLDADGSLDHGEAGLSGQTVTLDAVGGGIADRTATTDGSGAFSFGGLPAGTYTLAETLPAGFEQTQPGAASYTFQVTNGFVGTREFGVSTFGAPAGLAISPDDGVSNTDVIADTDHVTLTGPLDRAGLSVGVTDLTTGADLGRFASPGKFWIDLMLAEGTHHLRVQAYDATGGSSLLGTYTVQVDLTSPTNQAGTLATRRTATTFDIAVSFSDPAGTGDASPSGVASVDLYVATDGGAYVLAQTLSAGGAASGSLAFTFKCAVGHTYACFTVATDVAGDRQATPTSA